MSFDWNDLGTDEGGLPIHLPMGVNEDGEGPEDDASAHHWRCWCVDPTCPLTRALLDARQSGVRA